MADGDAAPRRGRNRSGERAADSPERPEDELLTTAQVAALLQVTPKLVIEMVNAGLIPAYRLPGMRQYRFFRQRILDVIEANPVVFGEPDDEGAETTGVVNGER